MEARRSVLHDMQITRARMALYHGWELPEAFGDAEEELRQAVSGCVLLDNSAMGRLLLAGKDGLDLLHRLSTNDIRAMGVGEVRRTVLTTEKGRVLDMLRILRRGEDCLVLTSPTMEQKVLQWVGKFTIMEELSFRPVSDETVLLTVAGPASAERISALSGVTIAGQGGSIDWDGIPVTLLPEHHGALSLVHLLVPSEGAPAVWEAIAASGIAPAGFQAFESLRIIHGLPYPPGEISLDVNPYEVGLKEAINYTKGCYVGQEVIARLDTYQKVTKKLVGFVSTGDPGAGTLLLGEEDEQAGRITSVSPLKADRRTFGLAVVREGALQRRQEFAVPGSGSMVTVVPLPLAFGAGTGSDASR